MTRPELELSPAKRALREARLRGQYRAQPIPRRAREGDPPLSFAQERLWFIDRLQPGSTAFNLNAVVRISGGADEAALERALGEVVRRHEALRTTFREVDGVPVQSIAPYEGFVLPVEDLSALGDEEREAEVRRRAARERAHVFDLSAGPLFHASLLRLGGDEHVLLLCAHHIVHDVWSQQLLVKELRALYDAYRAGWGSPLPEPEIQYADYCGWQRSDEGRAGDAAHLAYWKRQLAGAPELLALPTDRPRPPVPSFRGARVPAAVSAEVLERLRALALAEGATLHMVVLAAFQVLLSRYAASDDVAVGSPVAGRMRKELEGLIGLFVNTVVLRADLSGDPTLRALVGRVREMALAAYQHQDLPFERVVAELRPERSLAHSVLFQVMFLLDDGAHAPPVADGSWRPGTPADPESTQFDLTLSLAARPDGLSGVLEYSTDLFERGTAERMAAHLARVLEQMADDADARLSEIDLLGDAERRTVLEEWNRTDAPYPAGRCVHQLIEDQAARTPAAEAVVFDDERLTYAELDARANRLARRLAALGAGPEARVAICLDRSAGMVVAMLAVLKAGAAYVPLDPSYPADRLAYMLEDSGASVLVTQSSLRTLVPAAGARTVVVDGEDAAAIAAEAGEGLEMAVAAENAAYVIYTSGSTGRPKGVVVTHANVAGFFAGMDERVGAAEPGTWLAVTRISFDIHVLELLWTLARGFRVVVSPDLDQAREEGELARSIRRHGVTHLQCTPSLASILLAESGAEALAGLDRVLLGGEALPAALAAEIDAVLPGRLLNMYGPTETTVWSATHAVDRVDATIPIGRPIANTRVYVLDAALRPRPIGVPGELFVAGAGVARGYLARPGLTAERFLPDPFSPSPGARIYRTGDRARWRADGVLEYLGRADQQVKVRGFRIEPGEIESALRRHPAVRECAVVAREDASGEKRLVGYVVGDADGEALRAHLRGSLPEYMVPGAFVRLDALPLTPNGKLDRRALPAPERTSEERYTEPRTPVEALLAGIWAEVLGLERVGVRDGFFQLGGDSILSIRVVSRARRAGVEITPRQMVEHQTIAELAAVAAPLSTADARDSAPPPLEQEQDLRLEGDAAAEGAGRTASDFPLAGLTQAELDAALAGRPDVEDLYPLSPLQEGILFHALSGGETQAYQLQVAQRLEGCLDADLFRRAWAEAVRRHAVLRTGFVWRGLREPLQRVERAADLPWTVEDWRELPAQEREAALERRLAEDRARGFVLEEAPLMRCALFRVEDESHWFVCTLHHLVMDRWTCLRVQAEVFALYEAWSAGRTVEPPRARRYRDYIAWLRRQELGEAERYWRGALAGFSAPTPVGGAPAAAPAEARYARRGVALSPERTRRLEEAARRMGVTPNTAVQAAWGLLLARRGGDEDVVFGITVAGRPAELEGVEEMAGMFLNTIPLRLRPRAEARRGAWLREVQRAQADALQYQHAPLVRVQQWSQVPPGTPLFESLVVFRNAMDEPGGGAPAGAAPRVVEARATEWTNYPLTLGADPGRELRLTLSYDERRFQADDVERMLHHLARILDQLAEDADARLAEIDLLGEAERRTVLEEWNRTDAPYPTGRCIHQLIEDQAARTPAAEAVVFDEERLTYAELDACANRLARRLAALGAGPEARVAICLERSAGMVVAMLAVLKAGAAYVPLDPSYPADRLAYMLEDSGASVLVTQSSLRTLVPAAGARTVVVDAEADTIAAQSDEALRTAVAPENAAYVIYTSGSTGRPKGVVVTHANVAGFFAGMDERVGASEPGTWLAVTRISFDIHVLELLWTLARGFRVVVSPDLDQGRGDGALARAIHRHRITHLQCTPSLAAVLIAESGAGALAGLDRVLLGGEALPTDLAAQIDAVLPGRLLNMYGPTETTVWSATHAVSGGESTVPIGRPIANTRVYVLDDAFRPQPIGIGGELYVAGAGVARGYLARPALTAERFLPDAFSPSPGARLYRTGDRARWRADGVLEYLGRADQQVKVRGFRIEPGEIESALRRHPAVRECAVVAREDASGEKRLIAYVVGEADGEALRTQLRESLPEYMVPGAFVRLDSLPLTPNGKLDRKALPAPEGGALAARGWEAPVGEMEQTVAEIWGEVLGVGRVGRWDHFFELGGHSLRAVQVVSRVRLLLEAEAAPGDLFVRPVLADFARGVETAVRAELPPIEPGGRGGRLEPSFAQARLWFLHRLGAVGSAYHIPARMRLRGLLDRETLARALERIVARHEVLRTTFPPQDGEPVQRIAPAGASGFRLQHHDLQGRSDAEAELRRLVADEEGAPFDLERGPLVRARLVRMAADEHVLLVTMHHVVSDGWSMGLLTHELGVLYGAFARGGADPLPPLPIQYADYAAWQRREASGEALRRQAEYWRHALMGAPELLELPADRARPLLQDHAGAAAFLELDEGLTAALRELSRRHGATLFMTLLAGWAAVLGRLAGQDDVVVGTPSANRGRGEVEGLIGLFVNTLALRVDLSGSPTVGGLIARVKARALAAQHHQDIPFEQVVEMVRPARTLAHTPVFQVMFAWQNVPLVNPELPGIASSPVDAGAHVTAKFDLSLVLAERGGRIVGGLEYATALFDAATVERFAASLRSVLEAMAADDHLPVGRLPMLPEAERRRMLVEWNATAAPYPDRSCIHELFQARAEREPDAPALVFEGESIRYGELNARANRLAHHLRAMGVGPDARVAICAGRGPEAIVGVLAVLKAGGAYVPLDPAYPAERLRYVLADSAPAVVLTHGLPPGLLGGTGVVEIDLAADASRWADRPETDPDPAGLAPDHLAYVIYTSGSTGTPKGVAVPHRGVVHVIGVSISELGVRADDRVAQMAPLGFDASVLEIFAALSSGAALVLVPRETGISGDALAELFRRERVTHAATPPSRLEILAPDAVPSLRCVIVGGEAPTAELARRWAGGRTLFNAYAPTETTIYSTLHRCSSSGDQSPPIGRPIANTRVYVLDSAMEPVPVGVTGELYVGGVGVVRGYLGRPALTAERFLPDPFSTEPGARLYRTGDLGRWKEEGAKARGCGGAVDPSMTEGIREAAHPRTFAPSHPRTHAPSHSRTAVLEFLGRNDFQVKIRGFRIELGEIEARLAEHPAVREAVVLAREDAPGERRLVAYHAGGAEADALRAHLAERLPEYMVPAAYVRLDALPRTPAGKVDRRALPAPDGDAYARRGFEEPVGWTEAALAEIWSEMLGVERVGRHDHFFQLGGHSLLASKLALRIQEAMEVDLTLRAVFEAPVLSALALRILDAQLAQFDPEALASLAQLAREPAG